MSPSLARTLSYILHPLLMPFFAIVLVMNLNTYIAYSISPQVQRIIISLVFITTGALPVLVSLILLQKGMIRSLEMDTVAERRIPFITTAVFYLICFFLLKQLPVPRLLSLMVLGATITIFIAWLLSYKWKVSIHMIGIGGLTGMFFGLSQMLNAGLLNIIILVVLISGILGTARLILGAHTPRQIYIGFLIGFFTEWLVIMWFSN
ncbi:MAG TPA: hypothetical protein PKD91_00900 [Bacteroidia bacterium]|nr:hypothetical protein [Bacteroidia bacterium]